MEQLVWLEAFVVASIHLEQLVSSCLKEPRDDYSDDLNHQLPWEELQVCFDLHFDLEIQNELEHHLGYFPLDDFDLEQVDLLHHLG